MRIRPASRRLALQFRALEECIDRAEVLPRPDLEIFLDEDWPKQGSFSACKRAEACSAPLVLVCRSRHGGFGGLGQVHGELMHSRFSEHAVVKCRRMPGCAREEDPRNASPRADACCNCRLCTCVCVGKVQAMCARKKWASSKLSLGTVSGARGKSECCFALSPP